jgi:hypothetical protein
MATTLQIKCINKLDRDDPSERITQVGGSDSGGWKHSQQQAIRNIENGTHHYWVSAGGKSVWVEVAVSRWGNKYIKTQNDGEGQNNLLSLPECR